MNSEGMIVKCKFRIYLNEYDKEFILNINNSIVTGSKYKDILEMINGCKTLNNLQKPSKHFMEKHHSDCLKNFKPIMKKKVPVSIVDDEISDVLTYTDYSKKKKEDIPSILKDKMVSIACKLLDIADHRLNRFTASGGVESVKDTVASLKTIIDVFNTGINSDSDNSIKDYTIEELRETDEFTEYMKNKKN